MGGRTDDRGVPENDPSLHTDVHDCWRDPRVCVQKDTLRGDSIGPSSVLLRWLSNYEREYMQEQASRHNRGRPEQDMGFFSVYLLIPHTGKHLGTTTNVGFTVSPARRICQHNREIWSGALATLRLKPWDVVYVVHGSPSCRSALV